MTVWIIDVFLVCRRFECLPETRCLRAVLHSFVRVHRYVFRSDWSPQATELGSAVLQYCVMRVVQIGLESRVNETSLQTQQHEWDLKEDEEI